MDYQTELYKIKDQLIEWEQRRRDITMLALFEALVDYKDKLIKEGVDLKALKVRQPMFGDLKIIKIDMNDLGAEILSVEKLCGITYREVKDTVKWGEEKAIVINPKDTILSLAERYINKEYETQAIKTILNDSVAISKNSQKTSLAKKNKI